MLTYVERLLNHWLTHVVLASLIVLSVLPIPELRTLDIAFFCIFGTELALRVIILRRGEALTRTAWAMLLADAVALISFLPFLETFVGARVLRLIRLVRLVVLVRFLRTLVGDLKRILGQRQIRYQLAFLLAAVLLFTFLGSTILATFEVPVDDFNGDGQREPGSLTEVLWWVFRQIEDPGNLVDDAAGGTMLLITSLFLTIAGVFVMSFIIGIGSSVVGDLMAAGRHRPVDMQDHTVVIGGGRNVREVLEDLLEMYGKNRRRVRVAVLGETEEPPPYLEEPTFKGVQYRAGESSSLRAHELLSTEQARRVIVLNDEERGESSDAYAVSSVLAVRDKNESCPIFVEMRHRRYMDAAREAGGSNVNPIPIGKFLGGLLSHNIMFPGIDEVFEELLTARGSEIYSHIFSVVELRKLKASGLDELTYRDVLLHFYNAHGLIPIGVFLGSGRWTTDVGALSLWLNPLDEPTDAARRLGARRGHLPVEVLRGFMAVAPEYSTLKRAVVELISTPERVTWSDAPDDAGAAVPGAVLCQEMCQLRRIIVLGENELLPAMLENTAEFVSGVEFLVVAPTKARRVALSDELRRRGGHDGSDSEMRARFPLARGGQVTLHAARGDMLASALEHPFTAEHTVDVVVLLADSDEADPDANSTLMLLRLLEQVRDDLIKVGPRFRVIAEALSARKGERLEERAARSGVSVRVVPTQQMRSYFLVDGAYMPGSERVHLELLSPHQQDFCQLCLSNSTGCDDPISFTDLVSALSSHVPPVIPFGVTLRRGHRHEGLVLNPKPGDTKKLRFRPSDVDAIYAVGETELLERAEKAGS